MTRKAVDPDSVPKDSLFVSAKPSVWNVLILGAWNTAILTPDGIRERLFGLPDGSTLVVDVPTDRPGPFRVHYDGLIVTATSRALEISLETPTLSSLRRACALAIKGLDALPLTPVYAAGVNLRFQFDEVPISIVKMMSAPLDESLADAGCKIQASVAKRSLELLPGSVNLDVATPIHGRDGSVALNFHLDSADQQALKGWLGRVDDFAPYAKKLAGVLGDEFTLAEAT